MARERAEPSKRPLWHADVRPAERWGWYVHLGWGTTSCEGSHWSPTRERAERWARREIEKLQRREDRRKREEFTVGAPYEPQPRAGVQDPVDPG